MIKFLNINMYIYITQLDLHVDATVLLARDHPALGNRDLQFAFYWECCSTYLSCRAFEIFLQRCIDLTTCIYLPPTLLSQATFDAVRTLVIRLQYLPHALIPILTCNELVSQHVEQ